MLIRKFAIASSTLVLGLSVAACGGGGVTSTPTPTPAPTPTPTSTPTPTPTPTPNLFDTSQNKSFQADDAGTDVSFDLTTKKTIDGDSTRGKLAISFDASSRSYTLTAHGQSQTFSLQDTLSQTTNDVTYFATGGGHTDYLTLIKVPYTSSVATKYVALGYWQRNSITGNTQDTWFDTFTYGYATASSAVPRTGNAAYGVDVFGLATNPDYEPRVFEGHGRFDVDFLTGAFSTQTNLVETNLITGGGVAGGGIELVGAGKLSSDNSFTGGIRYGGDNLNVSGTIDGQFYGPSAQELGASFSAENSAGATVTGSMTGSRDTSLTPQSLALTNMVSPQLFYGDSALLDFIPGDQGRTTTGGVQLNDKTGGIFTLSDVGQFTAANKIASSDANFVSYKTTVNGEDVFLDLFKPGSSNTKIALTYMSFGRWNTVENLGQYEQLHIGHFVYGFETPAQLLSARTGTAHYAGYVFGTAGSNSGSARYDLSGTAAFDVNFTSQSYSGALTIAGAKIGGGGSSDFGTFTFASPLSQWVSETQSDLMQGGTNVGILSTRFYGPNGEEIGGPFTATVLSGDPIYLSGVAIGKR